MKTPISMMLLAAAVSTVHGAEFKSRAYLPEAGIEVLNRETTETLLDRALFAQPYAGAVFDRLDRGYQGGIQVQSVQAVTDPVWSRIILAGKERGVAAYDGRDASLGALNQPRGISATWDGRLFVADTGNDRVLVFKIIDDGETLDLEEIGVINGLHQPHDVAWSDGGTPWESHDDRLYIADTGSNRVLRYTVSDFEEPKPEGALGGLGSGRGRFAGPVAVGVGSTPQGHTDQVYVADAHSGRLVTLRDTGWDLEWQSSVSHGLQKVTSVESDTAGNLFLTAPLDGVVAQWSPEMEPVSKFSWKNPQHFHLVNRIMVDHRTGEKTKHPTGDGILIADWETGISRWTIHKAGGGSSVQPVVIRGNRPNPFSSRTEIRFALTGTVPEAVTLNIFDHLGRLVNSIQTIAQGPGEASIVWDGLTSAGSQAASGVYMYHLKIQGQSYARKMVIVR